MGFTAATKRDASKTRIALDIDRKLWLRFKGRVGERGETLTGRLQELISRDLKSRASEPDPEPAATS